MGCRLREGLDARSVQWMSRWLRNGAYRNIGKTWLDVQRKIVHVSVVVTVLQSGELKGLKLRLKLRLD